jgi:hypothetical protein
MVLAPSPRANKGERQLPLSLDPLHNQQLWTLKLRQVKMYLMAKIQRDIWGKAAYGNHNSSLNCNRFTSKGYSLNKNTVNTPQCVTFNVLSETGHISRWLRKTYWSKFHWIIHVCISCVDTEPESIQNLLHSLVSFCVKITEWIKPRICGNLSFIDYLWRKHTVWVSKPG